MNRYKKRTYLPLALPLEEGKKYAWCTCGFSEYKAFCDGSHKGLNMEPLIFIAKETKIEHLCMCKRTNQAPFCDESHQK